MKVLFHKLFNRLTITGLLIIIQLLWIVNIFLFLAEQAVWINVFFTVLSVLIVIYIINKDENSAYKLGWILLICLIPLLGGLFYIFFGNKRPSKKLRLRLEKTENEHKGLLLQQDDVLDGVNPRMAATTKYITTHGAYPSYKNTGVKYYPLGEKMFKDMLVDLENADHYIFMEYFIIAESKMWDAMFDVLKRKASEGVDVRIMYDDVGSIFVLPKQLILNLKKAGIKCIPFNPFVPLVSLVMNNRDHRKILVIDGKVGYSGGINIADEYINLYPKYGHWKDTGLRLEGEAVWNFTVMFLNIWNAFLKTDVDYEQFRPHTWHKEGFGSDGIVQPYSDSPLDDEALGENIYIDILSQAKKYVYIFTPYLIIDNELQTALTLAAKRGVDVRIVTPGTPDKKIVYKLTRSYYPPLIKAGVKIYEYTPGFIHAKSYVCDDEIAVVGTINMDYRSLYLHFECGTLLLNCAAIKDIKKDCIETFDKSNLINDNVLKSNFFTKLFDALLRVLSPLL
ncbi:MAG: cardiolipin synthase [Anaerovoracaceae bacterium]